MNIVKLQPIDVSRTGFLHKEDSKWYVLIDQDSYDAIELHPMDYKFAKTQQMITIEYMVHILNGEYFCKINHPKDILERMTYSISDMMEIAQYGFRYSIDSMHDGISVPEGNLKQHLFYRFGIL